MDPWLESTEVWRGFHSRVINAASDLLQPQVLELGFFVDIDERIWLEEPERNVYPDLTAIQWKNSPGDTNAAVAEADDPVLVRVLQASEVREPYLKIYDQQSRLVITQIELISPTNKTAPGREFYVQKRDELKAGGVNIVEIDLLRQSPPVVDLRPHALNELRPWDYMVCVNRQGSAFRETYPIGLRQRLPRVRIPLRTNVPDVVLDLQAAVSRAYDAGPYRVRIDYRQPSDPELPEADRGWADELLREAGMR
jgi:hypothetical protein